MPAPNIAGQKFHRLLVIERAPNRRRRIHWKCICECGNVSVVQSSSVTSGRTKSCGCLSREGHRTGPVTHGMSHTSEYKVWGSMKRRCNDPNHPAYEHYGGRGISYCVEWQEFAKFYQDMGARPKGLTLDRIDNDGDYEPGNCRWATRFQQNNNKRRTRYVELNGERMSLTEAMKVTGCKLYRTAAFARIRNGWSVIDALTKAATKPGPGRRQLKV